MERLTRTHYRRSDHYLKCSEKCEMDDCSAECSHFDEVVERLAAYEDTERMPEEVQALNRLFDYALKESRTLREQLALIERLRELAEADKDGRLVVLCEPREPLIWGDEAHDTVLCPHCGKDLMGGFPDAESCEIELLQCPHCGTFVDGSRVEDRK